MIKSCGRFRHDGDRKWRAGFFSLLRGAGGRGFFWWGEVGWWNVRLQGGVGGREG